MRRIIWRSYAPNCWMHSSWWSKSNGSVSRTRSERQMNTSERCVSVQLPKLLVKSNILIFWRKYFNFSVWLQIFLSLKTIFGNERKNRAQKKCIHIATTGLHTEMLTDAIKNYVNSFFKLSSPCSDTQLVTSVLITSQKISSSEVLCSNSFTIKIRNDNSFVLNKSDSYFQMIFFWNQNCLSL